MYKLLEIKQESNMNAYRAIFHKIENDMVHYVVVIYQAEYSSFTFKSYHLKTDEKLKIDVMNLSYFINLPPDEANINSILIRLEEYLGDKFVI